MTVLAIDTSCDETAVAVVTKQNQQPVVLSNIIASQVELHKPYGGVFPTIAKQAHKENIDRCISLALKRARKTWITIDAVAVTQGPGLAPALEVGIRAAERYALIHKLAVIPINHIEGHVLSVLSRPNSITKKSPPLIKFPALSVIVSGGHTQFVRVTTPGDYQILGHTIDDAAGEALDKVGRMLGLGYPAGPVIETFAKLGNPHRFEFPLPMTTSQDYNLSYSGLKTFSRKLLEELETAGPLPKQTVFDFCASFQYAVFKHICHKLNKVLQSNLDLNEIWLGGGVAANSKLRAMLRQTIKLHVHNAAGKSIKLPLSLQLLTPYSKKLCGDNAAMIGTVAVLNHQLPKIAAEQAAQKIDRRPRWEVA